MISRKFFGEQAKKTNGLKAKELENLYNDGSIRLILTILKTVLQQVNTTNLAFEQTDADVTLLYSGMRTLVYSLVGRVLRQEAIAKTARPGTYTYYIRVR